MFVFVFVFSTDLLFPGPVFQECTGSCHENVPTPKAVSSDLQSTDGLTVLAGIEIVAILVHSLPSNASLARCTSDEVKMAADDISKRR